MNAAVFIAACLSVIPIGAAKAQVVSLVCEIEQAYSRERGGPVGWRPIGTETYVVDLRLQRRFGDGSCCHYETATDRVIILPEMFIFRSRLFARESVSIDRYSGRLSGSKGSAGTFVRGTCRTGRRQF